MTDQASWSIDRASWSIASFDDVATLHSGLDTVAIITFGVFTKVYGASDPNNIANLYASKGYLEDAPNVAIKLVNMMMYYIRRRDERARN